MASRFILFIAFFFLLFLNVNISLYAEEEPEPNPDEDFHTKCAGAFGSGDFASCGSLNTSKPVVEEFGVPQKPVDKDKPEGALTPIEQTFYAPEKMDVLGGSNVQFHFITFENNVNVTVGDMSTVDLQLYKNTTDVTFRVKDDRSVLTFRGGNSGRTEVYLNSRCEVSGGCFRTDSDIDYLNFEGKDGFFGGLLGVGLKSKDGTKDESAEITIQKVKGNGNIFLSSGSKLTIKEYEYDGDEYGDSSTAIQTIRGGDLSELIIDTSIYIRELSVPFVTFNNYAKIINIVGSEGIDGKITFNANVDITAVEYTKSLELSKGVKVVVSVFDRIGEINLKEDSVLELGSKNFSSANSYIESIKGDGTLHLKPDGYIENEQSAFKMRDADFNNLIFDEGVLIIENDGEKTYTNTYQNPDDEDNPIKEEHIRRIKNITKSNLEDSGGEIIIKGAVIFNNVDYLKKLTVCISGITDNCADKAHVTLKKVNSLEEVEVNSGKLSIWLNDLNYWDDISKTGTAALDINSFVFNGGKIEAVVMNTNAIKYKNSYTILLVPSASDMQINTEILTEDGLSEDNFLVSLPSWYRTGFRIENDTSLVVDVERIKGYEAVINDSDYASNKEVRAMANYFDNIVENQVPLNISAKTMTYVDLLATDDKALAYNLYTLIPVTKDKYIKDSHLNLKNALDISKERGMVNTKPYGLRDKRQFSESIQDDNFWFVFSSSSGKLDDKSFGSKADNDATLYQFGYNYYNWVSRDGKEGYSSNIVAGFADGNLENLYYKSDSTMFNVGTTVDYRNEEDILKFSFLYGISSFKTNKDYFINMYEGDDFVDLDKSRLHSSLRTHELLFDFQYSREIFVEYMKTFSNFDNLIIVPRAYVTPSIFIGENYKEHGEYSSLESDTYVSTLLESGVGADISKTIFFLRDYNIKLMAGLDAWYQFYYIPSSKIGFEETSMGVKLPSSNYSGLAMSSHMGLGVEYKKAQLSASYKNKSGKEYYQNIWNLSFKYSL